MIERADQLVLEYVSKAADAAHGVLRSDQRLDFVKRLRARIEDERRGSQDAREVVKVLRRFGDPVALVEREVRRLAAAGAALAPSAVPASAAPGVAPGAAPTPSGPGGPTELPGHELPGHDGSTAVFPRIVDDVEDVPPGVLAGRRMAHEQLSRSERRRGLSFAGLRRAAMSSANPMATEGRDAMTLVRENRREVFALVVLVFGALLIPFDLPAVAIFRPPVLVWALGSVIVLASSSTWALRDRLIGICAPILGYTVGGVLVGGLRAGGQPGLQAFFVQFYDISGVMFMIGTGLGVVWLAYRLWDVS